MNDTGAVSMEIFAALQLESTDTGPSRGPGENGPNYHWHNNQVLDISGDDPLSLL